MAHDPASEAVLAQRGGGAGYRPDIWMNVKLEPMTKLWQGIGGDSRFFFSEEDARVARGAYVDTEPFKFAETLWRLAQVQPHRKLGFRIGIREYVVDIRTAAAIGVCHANPDFGSGSVVQYYVPSGKTNLLATHRQFMFGAANRLSPRTNK
jgi:hypothetical protein